MISDSDLLNLISSNGLDFQTHNHDPLFTVQDSENLRGKIEGSHTKNLFLKNKKDKFFLFTCEENANIDLKRFSKSIDAKNLSFAGEGHLMKYLGIKPGSVSPYALLNDTNNVVTFYIDEKLMRSEIINFHPLVNTKTITTKTSDFVDFIIENNKNINIFSLESYSIVEIL